MQTVNAKNTGMETVQKEAQNVLVMMDINTLKRKTNVLVRMIPCIIIRKNTEIRDLKHLVLFGYSSRFLVVIIIS